MTKRSIHRVPVGGTLHVPTYEAKVLVAIGHARYVEEEQPETPPPEKPVKPARKKRSYKRRDMQAEDS